MPERIQRKRARGWRLPAGAVCVTRPGKWGNPFEVGMPYFVVDFMAYRRGQPLSRAEWHTMTAADAVDCYKRWFATQVGKSGFALAEEAKVELGGRDLACYCAPGEPCHGDFLLAVSNGWEVPDAR